MNLSIASHGHLGHLRKLFATSLMALLGGTGGEISGR